MSLDDLWGGVINSFDFDLKRQTSTLRVTTTENGIARAFRVVSVGVTHLAFRTTVPGPWDYAELTSASIEEDGKRLHVVLWTEDSTIVIEAASHEVEADRGVDRSGT